MRIAIDAMGGDYAPDEIIAGAVEAAPLLDKDDVLILIGPKDLVASKLSEKNTHNYKCIEVINAETVIGMDEKPVEAIRSKRNNSIDVMAKMGASGEVDAVISAGNTGACVAAFQMRMRNLPGVTRPGISVVFPTFEGPLTLCDVGANISCKPIHLYQYAVMASLYSRHNFGIEKPRIGIMSIGEEDAKGNETIKKARELLRSDKNMNFVGNVEGRDIFSGKCDVIVTDGYVGNVVLKLSEALVSYMFKSIKKELIENHKIMAIPVGHVMKKIYKKYDYHEYGGAPLLGINGTALICHGSSKARTIRSAILAAKKYHREHINEHIIEYLSKSDVRSADE
jgi:glycerol-3-phosphate acyltransferase PlsX